MTESCKGHFYHLLPKRTPAHNHVENQKPALKKDLSWGMDWVLDKWRKGRNKSEIEVGGGAGPQEEDLRENTGLDWKDREKHSSSRKGRGC